MRKTVIVVATAVLAVGSTSLSTSASAFGLLPLGGLGLIQPGLGFVHPGLGLVHPGVGLAQPGFRLAHPGFGPAHTGGGYGLGHLDGSINGRRFGGGPSYGGYDHGGQSFYRGYAYRAAPPYGGYGDGGQSYYGGRPDYGDDVNADESYDDSNYTGASARGSRSRRGAASR